MRMSLGVWIDADMIGHMGDADVWYGMVWIDADMIGHMGDADVVRCMVRYGMVWIDADVIGHMGRCRFHWEYGICGLIGQMIYASGRIHL
eukprot:533760-Amorphochlora_amoeboformis.AAC.2